MVLCSNEHFAARQVLDRVVAAVVAELEPPLAPAHRHASSWCPRQIPRMGIFESSKSSHGLDRIGQPFRVARTVREEHPVRVQGQRLFGRSIRRDHRHLRAIGGQVAQDVALDAVVIGNDMDWMIVRIVIED